MRAKVLKFYTPSEVESQTKILVKSFSDIKQVVMSQIHDFQREDTTKMKFQALAFVKANSKGFSLETSATSSVHG